MEIDFETAVHGLMFVIAFAALYLSFAKDSM